MSYVLAIDVGTSFTAAAVARFDQGTSSPPECLPLGLRGTSVPSVLFYPEEGPVLVGEAAERRGLDSPARVVREFKRRVGDAVPISVGTLSLPAEDVFAAMARWVADRAAEREGAPPSEIILTHPAAWGSHRTSLLKDALAARSLQNVSLVTEPEAAALHYASQVRVEEGSTIAVYDLGGGTFDTAVLRKAGSNRFELLGRPEGIENLGGADFDAAVLRYVAANTGGVLSSLDSSDPGTRAALARLQRECVEAKEALSADSEASISVLLPGFQQQVRLVRSEFEALIDEPIRDTVDALEQSLAGLKLEPADLSAVLLIGGSSRIPLVAELISEQLDRPIAVDADPKSSICLGAAAVAVLARKAAEVAAQAVAAADAGPAVADGAEPGHVPGRLASWSRKSTTAAGAMAGIAAQGAGDGQHGHRGGAHAPKPTVRLTAIAAVAAAFTVLSATAAQSPEGLSSLTSIFTPKADAAPEKGPSSGGAGGGGAGGAAAAGAGAEAPEPAKGLEASASKKDAAPGGTGLEVEASPTSRPTSSAAAEKQAADSGGTGALDSGSGTSPAPGTGAGGVTEPLGTPTSPAGTTDPAPGTSEPVPADTGTATPLPADPPPATEPPPPVTEEPPPPATEEPPPPPATEEPPPPVTEEPPPPATEEPPPPVVTEEPSAPAPEPTASTATESAPATDPATAAEPAA